MRIKICRNGLGAPGRLSKSIFVVVAIGEGTLTVRKDRPTAWKTFTVKSWVRWKPRREKK